MTEQSELPKTCTGYKGKIMRQPSPEINGTVIKPEKKTFKAHLRDGVWKGKGDKLTPFEELEQGHLCAIINMVYTRTREELENELLEEHLAKHVREITNKIPEDIRSVVSVNTYATEQMIRSWVTKELIYDCMEKDDVIQALKPEAVKRDIWENLFLQKRN